MLLLLRMCWILYRTCQVFLHHPLFLAGQCPWFQAKASQEHHRQMPGYLWHRRKALRYRERTAPPHGPLLGLEAAVLTTWTHPAPQQPSGHPAQRSSVMISQVLSLPQTLDSSIAPVLLASIHSFTRFTIYWGPTKCQTLREALTSYFTGNIEATSKESLSLLSLHPAPPLPASITWHPRLVPTSAREHLLASLWAPRCSDSSALSSTFNPSVDALKHIQISPL